MNQDILIVTSLCLVVVRHSNGRIKQNHYYELIISSPKYFSGILCIYNIC